jgi:SSS family solute:Na+ symporter
MVGWVIGAYLLVVIAVGVLGHRLFRGTGEDYFVASRTIGPVVLLLTLFGTHMTAFSLLGASDEAYRGGVAVFALMASSSAIQIPFLFYFVGTRVWRVGKRNGHLTQVEFIRDRYGSDWLGLMLFVVVVLLLLPYVLIGVMGGGDALHVLTGGPGQGVPPWVGSLLVCAVIFTYVAYGGMRSTAWVNAFQTSVFMVVGAVAFVVITSRQGGVGDVMGRLAVIEPEMLQMGSGRPAILRSLSFLLLPCSAGVFPHIFSHWFSARSAGAFRLPVVLYPLCIAIVWFPGVVLGMTARVVFPEPPGGPVLPALFLDQTGGLLAGLLGAGVLAAIMSSLDSQTLAAGTMFTRDIIRHFGFHDRLSERGQVLSGRLFVLLLLGAAFALSQVTSKSIFSLGVWSLTGFAALLPVVFAALFWRRSTKYGAGASILTVTGLWAWFYVDSLGSAGPYSVGGSGLMPVAVILPAAAVVLVVVSLLTRPPGEARVERFFPAGRQ